MSAAQTLTSGADLRMWRTNRALTIRALARLSAVSPRSIRRIEAGSHIPRPVVWARLEKALQSDSVAVASAALGLEPGSREELFCAVPWECDPLSQAVVRAYPDGMTYDQIAAHTGLDPATIARIEREALAALENYFGDVDALFDSEPNDGSNEYHVASAVVRRDMLFCTRQHRAATCD